MCNMYPAKTRETLAENKSKLSLDNANPLGYIISTATRRTL